MKKIEIEKDFMRKSNSFSYPNNLEDACCDFVATKSDNSKYLMEKETNQGENLNPNEIIEVKNFIWTSYIFNY